MLKTIFFLHFFVYWFTIGFAQNPLPGGIEGVQLWYTSAKDAQGHIFLQNKLRDKNHVVPNGTQIKPLLLNFNNAVAFNGLDTKIDLPLGQQDYSQTTFFTVYQATDSASEKIIWHYEKNAVSEFMLTTHRIADFSQEQYINFLDQPKDVAQVNAYVQYKTKDNKVPFSQILHIGSKPTKPQVPAQFFKGVLAEVIAFDKVLNYEEFVRVQTYLSLKYGIHAAQSYVNAKGDTLWSAEKNQEYASNITGLGRDDASGLYQKQSTQSTNPRLLTIGVGTIMEHNEDNTAILDNNSFLIWGGNKGNLHFSEKAIDGLKPLNKRWLMSVNGQMNGVETMLKFDTKQIRTILPKGEPYWLMIDRSGRGAFSSNQWETIKSDTVDTEGFAIFKNIRWDTEGSGTDVFTLGTSAHFATNAWQTIDKGNIMSVALHPNPTPDGYFTIRTELRQKGDVEMTVFDIAGKRFSTQILRGGDFYIFTEKLTASGTYLVTLTSGKDRQTFKVVVQ